MTLSYWMCLIHVSHANQEFWLTRYSQKKPCIKRCKAQVESEGYIYLGFVNARMITETFDLNPVTGEWRRVNETQK